jgi:hypothetical protein
MYHPRHVYELAVATALGEGDGNGRGSCVEGKIQEPMGKGRLKIEHRRGCLSRDEGRCHWCCRRNDNMRSGTKCASGVRYVCWGMNVRYLNRSPKQQQQSTAKSENDSPGVSRLLSCLRTSHHSNYNLRLVPWADKGHACDQNSYRDDLRGDSLAAISGQSLGNRLFPSSLGFEDKFHYFPCGAFSALAIRDVVADFFQLLRRVGNGDRQACAFGHGHVG